MRFCGLAVQNALRASQAVREMRVMLISALIINAKPLPKYYFLQCILITFLLVIVFNLSCKDFLLLTSTTNIFEMRIDNEPKC